MSLRTVGGTGLVAGVLVVPALAGVFSSSSATPAKPSAAASSCQLGNGISHVVNIVFDNVHFGRDNPNVPSDLERMPHLLSFLQGNGTILSNTHTPMIAHTADDSLSIYTGLYGDRHGQPLSNSYKGYNPDGSTDPAASFAYWTSPFADTAATPTAGHDDAPSMVYSDTPSGGGAPDRITPAPWVPFTRAGCNVGDFSTANMVLENAKVDLPTIFGANSPEVAQFNADPDSFKDSEVADYIGEAVHCAKGAAICADAMATKFGQSSPTPSAVTDSLPTEPGGYSGFQALFGAKYIAPQLSNGSTPNLFHNGYRVTDADGNLVDLDGNTITEQFSHKPGFSGFNPTATQSLAYLADMQEAGIPITYGYISDMHERKAFDTGPCTTASATAAGKPIGPGDECFDENGKAYDRAFQTFFERLASDGINRSNTLFVISAEENDQFDGANAGRALKPTPADCNGTTVFCSYPAGSIGELQANVKGLLSSTASATTAYDVEPQGASIYAHGQPGLHDGTLRQLERDTANMRGDNPYSGETNQKIVKYQAGAVEERILHMQTADPKRLPSYTLFPVPDWFFATSGPNTTINSNFAWNHGYYSPNIDVTWSSLVGPGVAADGIDGPTPEQSNQASDPNSTRTVPQASTRGTWVEEVDLRPTMLHLLGLTDDYATDGRVVSQVLSHPSHALVSTEALARAYQAINSSVGPLATATLLADSKALASGSSSDDSAYDATQTALTKIADARDQLATQMKAQLARAAAGHGVGEATASKLIVRARALLVQAQQLQ